MKESLSELLARVFNNHNVNMELITPKLASIKEYEEAYKKKKEQDDKTRGS